MECYKRCRLIGSRSRRRIARLKKNRMLESWLESFLTNLEHEQRACTICDLFLSVR